MRARGRVSGWLCGREVAMLTMSMPDDPYSICFLASRRTHVMTVLVLDTSYGRAK